MNPNAQFATGDVVKHKATGECAVVVERLGRNRIVVSGKVNSTAIWYAVNAKIV